MQTQRVIVFVDGGLVTNVECPPGIEVEVRDYDESQICDISDNVKKDLDGCEYVESIWCGSPEEGE